MLPSKVHSRSRSVRRFDLITPDGRVYRYPRPSRLQRLLRVLSAHADTAAISATILALIYVAGFAAEALDRSAIDACSERLGQAGMS